MIYFISVKKSAKMKKVSVPLQRMISIYTLLAQKYVQIPWKSENTKLIILDRELWCVRAKSLFAWFCLKIIFNRPVDPLKRKSTSSHTALFENHSNAQPQPRGHFVKSFSEPWKNSAPKKYHIQARYHPLNDLSSTNQLCFLEKNTVDSVKLKKDSTRFWN